jgi:hypothetical protein
MPSEKNQLSTWVNDEEANKIREAAEQDGRSVSSWLRMTALAKIVTAQNNNNN